MLVGLHEKDQTVNNNDQNNPVQWDADMKKLYKYLSEKWGVDINETTTMENTPVTKIYLPVRGLRSNEI